MSSAFDPRLIADAVLAKEMMIELATHEDADVTVRIAETFVDVCQVTYDERREVIVLHLHPDDVDDVLHRPCRRASVVDRA